MSTLYLGIEDPGVNFRQDVKFADGDLPRVLAYLMTQPVGRVHENVKSEVPDAGWSPGEGQTEADRLTIETQEWVERPASLEELVRAFANGIVEELLVKARAMEIENAVAAAKAKAIAEIPELKPIA